MVRGHLDTVLQHIRTLKLADSTAELPDTELLERFTRDHDEAAFAALMRRHGPRVLAVCRRVLRHEQDAEDACQAAFLVLARQAASIHKKGSLSSWLHGVAYRVSAHLRKSSARRRARKVPLDVPQATGPDPTWAEVRAILDEELGRLPQPYRAPLLLCYWEGKTRDEAAQELGWGLGALRGKLERAREVLRRRLARRGVTLSSALLTIIVSQEATASLPRALVDSTVRAALLTTAGQATTGVISTQVAALAAGALTVTARARLALASVFLLLVSLAGAGALAHQAPWAEPKAVPQPILPKARAAPPAEEDLDALIKALKTGNDKARVVAARKIGAMGPRAKRAVPALKEALALRKTEVQQVAAVALWKVDRPAFTAILKSKERAGTGRWVAVLALHNIGREGKELAPIVLAIAADRADRDREHALWALPAVAANPADAVPVLVEALQDERAQYGRMLSAQALGQYGPKAKAALPALHRALRDPDAQVRVDAAGAVWKIERQAAKVVPVLTSALEGRETAARQRAMRYLKNMGPAAKGAFGALLAFWKGAKGQPKEEAAVALKAIDAGAAARAGVK